MQNLKNNNNNNNSSVQQKKALCLMHAIRTIINDLVIMVKYCLQKNALKYAGN